MCKGTAKGKDIVNVNVDANVDVINVNTFVDDYVDVYVYVYLHVYILMCYVLGCWWHCAFCFLEKRASTRQAVSSDLHIEHESMHDKHHTT